MDFGKQHFLVLQRTNNQSKAPLQVRIVATTAEAIRCWNGSTRISPVFDTKLNGKRSPSQTTFPGRNTLFFLGPLKPEDIMECSSSGDDVWLTLGVFNLVLRTSPPNKKRILRWAEQKKVRYEVWDIHNGRIADFAFAEITAPPKHLLEAVATISAIDLPSELKDATSEYAPLMASGMSRAANLPVNLLTDLEKLNRDVSEMLAAFHNNGTDESRYSILGQLLTVNAGLSRFTSQTFAGTSPIADTECHFWSNSLLGIGIPVLALWQICWFLQDTLAAARIPERFSNLRHIRDQLPNLNNLKPTDPFWSKDHLDTIKLDSSKAAPQVPLVAYFSARDGFKSTETTLSAPLAAVSSGNSLRWSLMTITHEISHIPVRAALAELYPNLASDEELRHALQLLDRQTTPRNLLEEIRRYLMVALVMIDHTDSDKVETGMSTEDLKDLFERSYREVEELMVHVFDFIYFYGRDVSKYVNSIWVSWGVIPNVNSRVREYVVRTICAVLSNHLGRGKQAEETAMKEVLRCLEKLQKDGLGGDYVKRAIRYIEHHWDDEIQRLIFARKQIVRIARTFLFSKHTATAIRGETATAGGERETEGYTLRAPHVESTEIDNPLRFIEFYSRAKIASPAESAWLFYVLAFRVRKR